MDTAPQTSKTALGQATYICRKEGLGTLGNPDQGKDPRAQTRPRALTREVNGTNPTNPPLEVVELL